MIAKIMLKILFIVQKSRTFAPRKTKKDLDEKKNLAQHCDADCFNSNFCWWLLD